MSKISLKPADTGSATFTLEAPATNTNRTITLPDEAGSVLTSAGVPASAMPAGSVIQVVQTTFSGTFSTSSSSFVDTGLTLSITPANSANKIYILCAPAVHFFATADTMKVEHRIRNTTSSTTLIETGQRHDGSTGSTSIILWAGNICMTALDSPNSTSTQTYTFDTRLVSGTASRINDEGGQSTITLMEIAG